MDITNEQLVNSWLHGKSAQTKRVHGRIAKAFLDALGKPLDQATLMDLQQYQDSLEVQASTQRLVVAIIKSLYSFALEGDHITRNVAKGLKPPKDTADIEERVLSEEEVQRVLSATTCPRDHAIIHLLYHAGLRVSELVNLKWSDIRTGKQGTTLSILGKGSKRRSVGIKDSVLEEIKALPHKSNYVFSSRESDHISPRHVETLVRKAAIDAGIDRADKASPHWFRHSHVSHALDRDVPVHVVQKTVGHASLATTSRYAHAKKGESSALYLD